MLGTEQRHSRVERYCRKWMDIEIVILSEVSQTEKQKYLVTSVIKGIRKDMIQRS